MPSTKRAPDPSTRLHQSGQAVGDSRYASSSFLRLSLFWLDGFAVPALVVELVVEPVETLSRHSAGTHKASRKPLGCIESVHIG